MTVAVAVLFDTWSSADDVVTVNADVTSPGSVRRSVIVSVDHAPLASVPTRQETDGSVEQCTDDVTKTAGFEVV